MILTVNISNSNITLSAWEGDAYLFGTAVHTNPAKSADEYAAQLEAMLRLHHHSPAEIEGMILSCVVPGMLATLRKALQCLYSGRIYTVGPGLKTGLSIQTDNPAQLGSELVCCGVAAMAFGTPPCLLISMDTAISMTLLRADGAILGGAIAPGLKISADALCTRTAQLPQIDLTAPVDGVVGTNSVASVQAGLILGTACMLDGMIDRFSAAMGVSLSCIATGELACAVLPHCTHSIVWREHLIHEGLLLLYRKNAR